jgi:DNA polymerase-3 subunit delta
MMATHRVVVLHGLHHIRKADWQQLESYLTQPSETTAFICTSSDSDPRKFPPRLWQQATAVECARLEGPRLHHWVTSTVAQYGCHINEAALQEFLHDQEHDLQTLAGEIDKLCTYVGETRQISLDDVHAVGQASRLHSIFALSEALGTRQVGTALTTLEHLLTQGEPPLVILSMVVRHLRLLWSIKQLVQQRQDLSRMAKTLGVPMSVCRQLATHSRQFSAARLRHLYGAALEADLAFKTSNRPPKTILEGLILDVCGSLG